MTWTFSVMDGFDHYAPADATWKYRSVGATAPSGVAFTNVAGPFHGNAARFTGGGNYLDRRRGGVLASRGGMCHVRVDSTTWGATPSICPLQLVSGTSGAVTIRQEIYLYPDGHLDVRMGPSSGTIIDATAAGVFPFDRWVYLEYATALSSGTGGSVWLRLDSTEVLTITGVQTTDSTALAADVRWGNILADGNAVVIDFDDLAYTSSQSGSGVETVPPVWGGPHAVTTRYPVGPGDDTGFTPVGAATNWECCAEPVADGDTTYVVPGGGLIPGDLYRFYPADPALPALPASFDDPDSAQYDCQILILARDEASTENRGRYRVRFSEEGGTFDTTNNLQTFPVAFSYWYSLEGLDPLQGFLETLQVGWTGLEGAVFRGSQLVLELWYPAPPPAAGRTWAVWWP